MVNVMTKYYFKRGGKKVYAVPNTLAGVQNMAQREADKIGRAVLVYGEEAGRAARSVAKVYRRNPKSRAYYTLAVREDGQWSPQFGDYSKSVVEQERDDICDGYGGPKKKDTRILKTGARQAELNAAIRALNT
jgi:hypothetical protein